MAARMCPPGAINQETNDFRKMPAIWVMKSYGSAAFDDAVELVGLIG